MLHPHIRRYILAPLTATVIAVGLAACSSDTRGLLAPNNAGMSLIPDAPLVVVNDAVPLTIVLTNSDGSPVADGTEVLLTATSGEFDAPKVRTQEGRAITTYRAGGDPGPVEIVGQSDAVQAQLLLLTASAPVASVSVSVTPEAIPDGGAEVNVKATVFGAGGERVVGAPVEFFASVGSFVVAGPYITNEQGEVITRLSVADETQVRARVHTVESPLLNVSLERRFRSGERGLPFDLSEVTWLHANVSDWKVTSRVTAVRIDHDSICIEHTKAGKWPRRGIGEGNPWVVAKVNGKWYAATYEYLRSGQTCKHIERRGDWGIGPHTKKPPLEGWAPRKGELVGFFVSTFARDSTRTSNERSNIQMVEWPY